VRRLIRPIEKQLGTSSLFYPLTVLVTLAHHPLRWGRVVSLRQELNAQTAPLYFANLAAEFRPYYYIIMLWYDFAVIKLNHLFESMDHIGLTQKLDASLRLWLNCSTVNTTVGSAGTPGQMAYNITPN
jgi:hypothetical protein